MINITFFGVNIQEKVYKYDSNLNSKDKIQVLKSNIDIIQSMKKRLNQLKISEDSGVSVHTGGYKDSELLFQGFDTIKGFEKNNIGVYIMAFENLVNNNIENKKRTTKQDKRVIDLLYQTINIAKLFVYSGNQEIDRLYYNLNIIMSNIGNLIKSQSIHSMLRDEKINEQLIKYNSKFLSTIESSFKETRNKYIAKLKEINGDFENKTLIDKVYKKLQKKTNKEENITGDKQYTSGITELSNYLFDLSDDIFYEIKEVIDDIIIDQEDFDIKKLFTLIQEQIIDIDTGDKKIDSLLKQIVDMFNVIMSDDRNQQPEYLISVLSSVAQIKHIIETANINKNEATEYIKNILKNINNNPKLMITNKALEDQIIKEIVANTDKYGIYCKTEAINIKDILAGNYAHEVKQYAMNEFKRFNEKLDIQEKINLLSKGYNFVYSNYSSVQRSNILEIFSNSLSQYYAK